MGDWILGLTCAALLTALACSLMPPGAVKQVGNLVCAVMLFWTLLRPLGIKSRLTYTNVSTVQLQTQQVKQELEQTQLSLLKPLIEQQCSAYISDKAGELGMACGVQVVCAPTEHDVWIPDRAQVSGALNQKQKQQLETVLVTELGIQPDKVEYAGGE